MFTAKCLHDDFDCCTPILSKYKEKDEDEDDDDGYKKEQFLDPRTSFHSNNDNNHFITNDKTVNNHNHKNKVAAATMTSSSSSSSGSNGGFIQHPVSKFDTLAGVAIKYGVEVSDIKKMNGLVTDLQMFALKTLKIPLPGRHPPSPCLCNGSDSARLNRSKQNPPRPVKTGIFDSFKTLKPNSSERKVSAAMSSLQGYYGLKPKYEKSKQEGFEMAIYSKRSSNFLEDDQFLKPSSSSNPPLSLNRKSKSLADGLSDDNNRVQVGETNCEEKNEKFTSRRLKSEADSPELLIRDDNNSGGAFSAITGKCLALRSKGACRSSSSAEPEAGGVTPIPINLMDSPIDDGVSVIKKSYSASSFQEQDGSNSSIWQASKWSMKPDLQALTASAITKQIFDGLSNPITGRRNKAALD